MTVNYDALWNEDATEAETIECYQALIDSGDAWRLEGAVGRTAMNLIESGQCTLGPVGHRDYYGNYVPGRDEVEPGTKGSVEYVALVNDERAEEEASAPRFTRTPPSREIRGLE